MTWLKESVETAKEILNNEKEDLLIFETKSRIYRKIRDIVTKSENCDKNIKTWGIVTASNPMEFSFDTEENKKRNDDLKKYIIESNFMYWMIDGKFGANTEKSFFIPNISVEDMIEFASMFGQESFIFGELSKSEDDDLKCKMTYWQAKIDEEDMRKYSHPDYRGERKKNGDLIPLEYEIPDGGYAYDIERSEDAIKKGFSFVTNHGRKFKFIIPFKCLEDTINEAADCLEEIFRKKDRKLVENRLMKTTVNAKDYCDSGRWKWRGYLYYNRYY